MNWFRKQVYLSETINLSVGRIKVKPLTNGLVNKILAQSCIGGTVINKLYMLREFEYALLNLSKRKIDRLNLEDGDKVRDFIKKLLVKNKIIVIEEPPVTDKVDLFKQTDKEWFRKTASNQINKVKGVMNG